MREVGFLLFEHASFENGLLPWIKQMQNLFAT